jgi:hypothetical protein
MSADMFGSGDEKRFIDRSVRSARLSQFISVILVVALGFFALFQTFSLVFFLVGNMVFKLDKYASEFRHIKLSKSSAAKNMLGLRFHSPYASMVPDLVLGISTARSMVV